MNIIFGMKILLSKHAWYFKTKRDGSFLLPVFIRSAAHLTLFLLKGSKLLGTRIKMVTKLRCGE
jgi:hypothetical protein